MSKRLLLITILILHMLSDDPYSNCTSTPPDISNDCFNRINTIDAQCCYYRINNATCLTVMNKNYAEHKQASEATNATFICEKDTTNATAIQYDAQAIQTAISYSIPMTSDEWAALSSATLVILNQFTRSSICQSSTNMTESGCNDAVSSYSDSQCCLMTYPTGDKSCSLIPTSVINTYLSVLKANNGTLNCITLSCSYKNISYIILIFLLMI
jgi:hypothetical protein